MTINFLGITYVADCDNCGDSCDTDMTREEGFMAAVEVLKKEGWSSRKRKGEWEHICPCCLDEEDMRDFNNEQGEE